MAVVYLSIGSNKGDKLEMLVMAAKRIEKLIGTIVASSSIYETNPWGYESQNTFYNQVLKVQTDHIPEQVLKIIMLIEQQLSRTRNGKSYMDRSIDIDILFYGNQVVNEDHLTIPHPRLHERGFVLVPMNEIADRFVHPLLRKQVRTLLHQFEGEKQFQRIMSGKDFLQKLTTEN